MILEKTIADPQEVLPASLLALLDVLETDTSSKLPLLIEMIKKETDEDNRLFALNYLHEYKSLDNAIFVQIYSSFLSDEMASIRWHSIVYLGLYGNQEVITILQPSLLDDYELVRASALWSLAKLTFHHEQIEKIFSELSHAYDDDRSRIFLASALFLINSNPLSDEMRFLEHFFLTHYYNKETNEFYPDVLLGKYGQSAEILGDILWLAGIEIVASDILFDLNLLWLIETE